MDQLYLRSKVRVEAEKVLILRRSLPFGKGEVKVEVGQEISPGDVLGDGASPTGFRTIHLSKEMEVSGHQAPMYLKRKIGQPIYKGEMLALNNALWGFNKKQLVSPVDGILESYDAQRGDLRIRLLPKRAKLISGVWGIVEAIDRPSGTIFIKTLAALIHGVAGTGREREGILDIISSPSALISSKQISPDFQGKIIVGGSIIFNDALEKAIRIGVSGIISGGIDLAEYKMLRGEDHLFTPGWQDSGITFMLAEGFGTVSIGEDIFNALIRNNGRYVIIDGNQKLLILPTDQQNSIIYIRKTKLSQTPIKAVLEVKLTVGQMVRVVSGRNFGLQGEIIDIDQSETILSSGLKTILVTVCGKNKKVRVPYLNIEAFG